MLNYNIIYEIIVISKIILKKILQRMMIIYNYNYIRLFFVILYLFYKYVIVMLFIG